MLHPLSFISVLDSLIVFWYSLFSDQIAHKQSFLLYLGRCDNDNLD